MPIGANCIFIVSKGYITTLLKYSYSLVYILFLEIINRILEDNTKNKKLITKICVCMFSLLIWGNIVFANQIYLKKSLEDGATLSYMTRLVDRMEQTEGYKAGETKVALIGNMNASELSENRPGFYTLGVGAGGNFSITYEGFEKAYFEQILGYPINLLSVEDSNYLIDTTEVKNLQAFPSSDCYTWIDDVLVFKLSE